MCSTTKSTFPQCSCPRITIFPFIPLLMMMNLILHHLHFQKMISTRISLLCHGLRCNGIQELLNTSVSMISVTNLLKIWLTHMVWHQAKAM